MERICSVSQLFYICGPPPLHQIESSMRPHVEYIYVCTQCWAIDCQGWPMTIKCTILCSCCYHYGPLKKPQNPNAQCQWSDIKQVLIREMNCSFLFDRGQPTSLSLHRGAFCQFPFRWIYYYGGNKSTGKETGKMHLCAVIEKLVGLFQKGRNSSFL